MTELMDRAAATTGPAGADADALAALTALMAGDRPEARDRVLAVLADGRFGQPLDGIDRAAYREQVLAWLRLLAAEGMGQRGLPPELGGEGDPVARIAGFEALGYGDLSLMVKAGVQWGLFGGAIAKLGTAAHHERYLRAAAAVELPGCFAMSELGHGSDVRHLRTTATYDPAAQEFVVDTPDEDARKDWIGNAAVHGRLAVVFAQLVTGGESRGVHALLVPIRNDDGTPMPGVEISDCGPKEGLNGVDNGRLRFHAVRVGRDALLDRYGQVALDGSYSSPIESPSRRFFTMLAALVEGRISVAVQAIGVGKTAQVIATRYALRRRQFDDPDGGETLLLDYLTHQRRLLPSIATTYALTLAHQQLLRRFAAAQQGDDETESRAVEALAAGIKAYASWHTIATVQACRECCGGKGYLAENRFGTLRADSDVFATFEGDNTVLSQLVAKALFAGADFEDRDLRDVVGDIAGWLGERLTPDALRDRLSGAHVADRDGQRDAFAFRVEHLLDALKRRLKAMVEGGTSIGAALLACQDHAVALAHAEIERQLVEALADAADAASAPVVGLLADLFATSRLEADRGWWLEHGYLTAAASRALPGRVNELCAALRPYAGMLVDAYGIPDALIAAPIAV